MQPVVIVASCESYRTGDFIAAARAQRLPVAIATDAASPFDELADRTVTIDLQDAAGGGATIAGTFPDASAVIAVDDQGVAVAAVAAGVLGLATNPPSAIAATRDKLAMRVLLTDGSVRQPDFSPVEPGRLAEVAAGIGLPVVVKPTGLSASRGVIRLDVLDDAPGVEERIRRIVAHAGGDRNMPLIAERYIEGDEMVLEGIMVDGALEVLAVIDKPVPLVGPFFEETMFVSPSAQTEAIRNAVVKSVAAAVDAIGLRTGPVHAEVRVNDAGSVFIVEIAARSIGGLCGRSLTFGLLGEPLESVIIRSAVGRTARFDNPTKPATGVLMLPIPGAGRLTGVEGLDAAKGVAGIDSIEMTIPIGRTVLPLPEGDRYLGFVFASGLSHDDVRDSLAAAARLIDPVIDGEYVVSEGQSDAAGGR